MNPEEIQKQFNEATNKAVAKFINDLPNHVQSRMSGAVAYVLGFENSYNGWKIDHCSARQSLVSTYVTDQAKMEAKKAIDRILTKKMIKELIKKREPAVKRDFRDGFIRHYNQALYSMAKAKAEDMAREHVDEMAAEMKKFTTVIDPVDPKCGNDPLTAALLENQVRAATDAALEKDA